MMTMATFAVNAENVTTDGSSSSKDVTATYVDTVTTPEVISVDITWGAMEFTYTESGTKTWDPTTHEYVESTSAAWTSNSNTIKVTNHSNVDINASFAYAKTNTAVSGSFSVTSQNLAKGVVGAPEAAANVTSKLTLTGAIDNTYATSTKVGSVTVTISKATAAE